MRIVRVATVSGKGRISGVVLPLPGHKESINILNHTQMTRYSPSVVHERGRKLARGRNSEGILSIADGSHELLQEREIIGSLRAVGRRL